MGSFLPYLVTIGAAASGGALAKAIGLPNGFLIGSLISSLLACRIYTRASIPRGSLQYVQIVLGFELGGLFADSSQIINAEFAIGALFLLACLITQIGICFFWLKRVFGWSTADALLASYPGAMAAVLDILDKRSASPRVIMVHVMRLLLLTVAAGLLAQGEAGPAIPAKVMDVRLFSMVAGVIAASLLGGFVLERGRVPAPYMLVTTFLVASVFGGAAGASLQVPDFAMRICEILLALLITIRFKDADLLELRGCLMPGAATIVLMLLVTLVFAWFASGSINRDFPSLALAYVPGGVESVAVIALSSGLEAAFIMKLHLTRLVVVQLAPALLPLLSHRWLPSRKLRG